MQYVLFFYSPYSGDNKILQYLDIIINKYQQKGFSIVPFRVTSPKIVDDTLKTTTIKPHHILIAGGDGTVNMVVNCIINNRFEAPIATLPAGTANDFAHVMGYPANIVKTCDMILSGNIVDIDLGVVNDRYFVNVLSAGLLTDVSQKTPTFLKNTVGKMAYYLSSLQELPRFRKIAIVINSDEVSYNDNALMFFIFNGKTAGNMRLAYKSDLNDGKLDVLIVRGSNLAETMNTAFHFISGKEDSYPKGIVYFKADKLDISCDTSLHIDIDGEAGPTLPINVRCIKGGLKVIAPNYENISCDTYNQFTDIMR